MNFGFKSGEIILGHKFDIWQAHSESMPRNYRDLTNILKLNRSFQEVDQLNYGDHGLHDALGAIADGIRKGKKIALYADYDVDGTMSCVSWICFWKPSDIKTTPTIFPAVFPKATV